MDAVWSFGTSYFPCHPHKEIGLVEGFEVVVLVGAVMAVWAVCPANTLSSWLWPFFPQTGRSEDMTALTALTR